MNLPVKSILNPTLTKMFGTSVVLWEVLPIGGSTKVQLRFESKHSGWRQGVWIRSDERMVVNGVSNISFTLWEDTSPSEVEIELGANANQFYIYNIWDKGSGRDSQSYNSGMLVECNGVKRLYRCHDVGREPDFSRLVFSLVIS